MKRKILSLFLSLFATAYFCSAQVIFDPATFDASTLPSGMKIVDINGSKYLQVVLDGWNSNLKVPVVKLYDKQLVKCEVKYAMGDKTNDTLSLSDINGVVQIMDTINKIKNPWGEGMVATSVGISQGPVTGEFAKISAASSMKFVHNIQFFGQEKKKWGPTSGDTIWVGKIKAVNANPLIAFDVNQVDPADLPSGMSIVENESGKKYLQVVLDGWNSTMNINPIQLGTGKKAVADFEYSLCSRTDDTLDLADINGVIQLMDTVNKVKNPWGEGMVASSTGISEGPVSGKPVTITATMSKDMKLINQIQFFGQEKKKWGPTKGDTIWVSKVKIVSNDPMIGLDPAEIDPSELPQGMSVVTISNEKYLQVVLNGWNSTINILPVNLTAGLKAECKIKYAMGDKTNDTLTLNDINAVVQIMDTVNKVKNPWGEGMVASSTGINQGPATGVLGTSSSNISKDMKLVNQVQFFGQEKKKWGPTSGDTIWVSKITFAPIWSEFSIAKVIVGKVDNATDYKGSVKMKWDADSVYMSYNVVDDSIVSTGNVWDVDNLEVYFDMDNSKNIHWPRNGGWRASEVALDTNDFQLRLNPDLETVFSVGAGALYGDGKPNVVYTKVQGGYTFTMNIAWKTLLAGYKPAGGNKIGFDVLLSDNDIDGSGAGRNQITITSTTDKAFNDPSLWGTLELVDGGTFKVVKDAAAPADPANLTAEVTDNNIALSWDASTDNIAVLNYKVELKSATLDSIILVYPEKEGAVTFTVKKFNDGDYTITVIAQDNFGNVSKAASTTAKITYTGIKDASAASVALFPNPATDYITISNIEKANVQIFNTSGQLVMVKSVAANENINVSNLNNGIYTVRINANNNVSVMKLMKK